MDKDALDILLRRGLSIERIAERFGKNPTAVEDLMRKYGLEPAIRDKPAATERLARERLEALVREGMSTREIAAELRRSQTTVRERLRRYGLRTRATLRAAELRQAREAGQITVLRTCNHHRATEFTIEGRGYYGCKRCRMEAVARRPSRYELCGC
jgi:transposase